MSSWTSYPKIYALGHKAISALLEGEVVVQEKVDGSQFSFGLIDGVLKTRSRGREFDPNAPDQLFAQATAHVRAMEGRLVDGVTYRCEVISKPKHNTLQYGRVPDGCMVIFDVTIGEESYADSREALEVAASALQIEAVPEFYRGPLTSLEQLHSLMERESFLGTAKVEGVVVKNYNRWGVDGKPLFGKLVSEAFKETNKLDWKDKHPGQSDIKMMLGEFLRKERRWEKAMERMRDNGTLTGEPADIGQMIREVASDVEVECADVIKERLWEWAKKDLLRASTRGLPEWYKNLLAQQQFEQAPVVTKPFEFYDEPVGADAVDPILT